VSWFESFVYGCVETGREKETGELKNAMHRVMIAGLLLMLVLTLAAIRGAYENVAAQTDGSGNGLAEIDVSVRGTYLRADQYQGGGGTTESPAIVGLQAYGIAPGDKILVSFEGQVNSGDAYWRPDEPVVYQPVTKLIAVFSASADLAPIDQAHRVPGAIDAGTDYESGQTYFGKEDTDIPEDFAVTPDTGFSIEVPPNAQYLFICLSDSYYPDNIGSVKVTIEKDTGGAGGGLPFWIWIVIGLAAVLLAGLALFLMGRRRPAKQ
jgi:hypothetical protein